MPDANGWHVSPFFHEGRTWRHHYCEGAEHDTRVLDTPEARAEHEQQCRERRVKQLLAEKAAARERSLAALRLRKEWA